MESVAEDNLASDDSSYVDLSITEEPVQDKERNSNEALLTSDTEHRPQTSLPSPPTPGVHRSHANSSISTSTPGRGAAATSKTSHSTAQEASDDPEETIGGSDRLLGNREESLMNQDSSTSDTGICRTVNDIADNSHTAGTTTTAAGGEDTIEFSNNTNSHNTNSDITITTLGEQREPSLTVEANPPNGSNAIDSSSDHNETHSAHSPGPPRSVRDHVPPNGSPSSGRPTTTSTPIATPTATPRGELTTPEASEGEEASLSSMLGASPYVMVGRGKEGGGGEGGGGSSLVEVSQFESPGLLYAKSVKEKHNLDMLRPADEVAEDVLGMIEDDSSNQLSWTEEEKEEKSETEKQSLDGSQVEGETRDGTKSIVKQFLHSTNSTKWHLKASPSQSPRAGSQDSLEYQNERRGSTDLAPLDPKVLRDLELQARKVSSCLDYIMENLHNSLHAMTVCAKQSVMLHKESVDNLHSVVDTNVKATYSFLAKFEELQRHTEPLAKLSQQIKEIDKILKVLERSFRTPP